MTFISLKVRPFLDFIHMKNLFWLPVKVVFVILEDVVMDYERKRKCGIGGTNL